VNQKFINGTFTEMNINMKKCRYDMMKEGYLSKSKLHCIGEGHTNKWDISSIHLVSNRSKLVYHQLR